MYRTVQCNVLVLKTHIEKKNGNLTMKEMRLRLSPLKSTSHSTQGPFGHLEESDTEDGSMYQEPFRLVDPNPEFRKLVKNYSCGRLCDYDDFGSLNPGASNKFGSTPLFNLQTNDRMRKPTTSKSFTNNLYEKDYRKPSFDPGYSVPVSKSRHSLARALSVSGPEETFYAATDIIQVIVDTFYAATDILQVKEETLFEAADIIKVIVD